MMVQSASFIVLVTALLIKILSYCSAEDVYCVTPTATSCSSCPHNSSHNATLSEYAQEAELYFTSNTTMVFLPGDHVLDRNITVANVARLTMHGQSSSHSIATIVRNGSVGFSFTNMVDFNIYSLAFTSYNRSWSYGSHLASTNSALLLKATQNAKLVNCSFHDNLGTGLTVNNTNITLTENIMFIRKPMCMSVIHGYGCGIAALNSTLIFTGKSFFCKNTQTISSYSNCAGAVWASGSSLHFNGTNNFTGNSAHGNTGVGGAIYATSNTTLGFSGISNFTHNSAEVGGVIGTVYNVVVTFHGTNNFINNSAEVGGAIATYYNGILTFHGNNNFIDNSAWLGGAILADSNSHLSFRGNSDFSQNSADYGGAIFAYTNSYLNFSGNSNFSHNSAENDGGAINTGNNVTLTFDGTNTFFSNSATEKSGAIYADTASLSFNGTNTFFSNSATEKGGAIYADTSSLSFNGSSSLTSNSAVQGGAIFAYASTMTFNGKINFTNNRHNTEGTHGGAMYLYISSAFSILPHTIMRWENNHANLGGAIYVHDGNPQIYCTQNNIPKPKCFFQLPRQNLSSGLDVQLVFKDNTADVAGSMLYGGAVDNCILTGLNSHNSSEVFDLLFQYEADNTTSSISSDPFRVCICENNHPDCSKSSEVLSVHRGESYQVSVVAVGQRNGIVPANVTSVNECNLLCSQTVQQTSKTCTTLNYTVDPQQNVSLKLYADGPCSTFDNKLVLELNGTQKCPDSLENSSMCICDQALKYGIEHCTITKNESAQITHHSNETFWVWHNHSDLIFYPYCPFEYCVSETVVFSLDKPEMQCAHNRTGILCGCCKKNFSLALGTFKCRNCTNNNNLALVIPFALMGIALVFLLFICKLTVATGTLSGLVLYANIVRANRTIFLPGDSTDALSVFIAWLNLDFGIETCFYDGMDAYGKTWLQFVFPVYLWVLVGLMILISHFSQRFANLLGSNPVSVLATLILLSYTKVLRTLIAAVYIAYLEYPKDKKVVVWLYDATDYLRGKHILLLLVAVLIFLFLFLPYTLLLLFGQWLQAISHLRLFSWVNSARLKAFMDSYHAPYKAKHRYWPGLLLVLRFVLLIVFAINPQQDPSVNLLAIVVGAGVLQMWAWVSGGVYKNWCLDALEGSFALNLIMLVGATYCVKLTEGDQLAVGYTSVSIALVTFIGILAYHVFQQLRHTKLWKKMPKVKLELKKLNTKEAENSLDNAINNPNVANFDQLREPLLEDLLQPTHSSL